MTEDLSSKLERSQVEASRYRDALWEIWEMLIENLACPVCSSAFALTERALWREEA